MAGDPRVVAQQLAACRGPRKDSAVAVELLTPATGSGCESSQEWTQPRLRTVLDVLPETRLIVSV
jgi:hypothetical protein